MVGKEITPRSRRMNEIIHWTGMTMQQAIRVVGNGEPLENSFMLQSDLVAKTTENKTRQDKYASLIN